MAYASPPARVAAALASLLLAAACGSPAGRDGGVDRDLGDPCLGLATCEEEGRACDGDLLVTCAPNADGCLVPSSSDCSAPNGGFCDADADPPACEVDPCRNLESPCDEEARRCDGDVLVVCRANADGCLVEARTDCAAEGSVCDPTGAMTACRTPVDPCADLPNACPTALTRCEGDERVACQPDAFGCLVETRTDCAVEGASCNRVAQGFRCTGGPACEGDDLCPLEETLCEGPVLSRCAFDAFGCLREARDDCTALENGVCRADEGRCAISPVDPCFGVEECPAPSRSCDVDVLEVCAPDARGCLVASRTDCFAGDGNCVVGEPTACVPSPCPVARTRIDCASGIVPADTASGSDAFAAYACTEPGTYGGQEVGFLFDNALDARVTLTATPRAATAEDFDLVVLEPGEAMRCDGTTPCRAEARTVGSTESVTLDVRGGRALAVFYDAAGPGTVPFDLEVSCEETVCGDGRVGVFETCDDGGTADADGCDSACQVELLYECAGEPSVCNLLCSNGRVDDGETCDDGNLMEDDGCNPGCRVELGFECVGAPSVCTPLCGNGRVDSGLESCDDANAVAGDGCFLCAREVPEDSILTFLESNEATDPTFDAPTTTCAMGSTSGHNYDVVFVVNPGTEDITIDLSTNIGDSLGSLWAYEPPFDPSNPLRNCLSGGANSLRVDVPAGERRAIVSGSTTAGSLFGPYALEVRDNRCGNGLLSGGEGCDDGNVAPGDGCSDMCGVELGFECAGEPSVCTPLCGNGDFDAGEICDDDNTVNGDGCSDRCTVEDGYQCRGVPVVCSLRTCGDSTIDVGESCDDGNATDGDGCSDCGDDIAASGSGISFSGSLDLTDPTWVRPFESCGFTQGSGFHFDEYRVTNATGADQELRITGDWMRLADDGYLHVMTTDFNPQAPLPTCLAGDNDFMSAAMSRIDRIAIADGESLVIVVSTFTAGDDLGSYTLDVDTL
ncbi:MAG: DUF4215 domain-containing protein [Sandaracinaceae bacterium]